MKRPFIKESSVIRNIGGLVAKPFVGKAKRDLKDQNYLHHARCVKRSERRGRTGWIHLPQLGEIVPVRKNKQGRWITA